METLSALLALCAGNSPVSGEFPSQRPVVRSFDVFFDLRLNKRLSKLSWGWWFETTSHSLWRHCNGESWHPIGAGRNNIAVENVLQQSERWELIRCGHPSCNCVRNFSSLDRWHFSHNCISIDIWFLVREAMCVIDRFTRCRYNYNQN